MSQPQTAPHHTYIVVKSSSSALYAPAVADSITLLLDPEWHPSVMGYRTSVPEGTQCCGLPYLCSRVTYDQTMPGSEALPILYAIGIVPSICHQNMTHKEVVLMPYAIRLFPVQRPCPYYVPSESVTLRGFGHAILYQSIPGVEILPMPCAL